MKTRVDMKLSKKESIEAKPKVSGPDGPRYPYGLQIRLDGQALDKLGMKTLPKVGSKITLDAFGVISSVSSHEHKEGGDRNVEIQIQQLAIDGDKPSIDDTIEKRYTELKSAKDAA